MMKRTITLTAVLLCLLTALSACLCGCNQTEKRFPIAVSDATRSVFELYEKPSQDSELEEIYSLMAEKKDIDRLHKAYPMQVLRKDENGYRVFYVGRNRLLIFYFDEDCNWLERSKLESMYYVTRTRAAFDKLKPGDPITMVQSADPVSYLPFLLEREGHALESDHFTQDGYHTHITYDDNLNILSITHEIA